jgi:hypothetical protein
MVKYEIFRAEWGNDRSTGRPAVTANRIYFDED